MSKTYQKSAVVVAPEQVTVALAEIAASAKEGLLALAVGTGLQVMPAMFNQDVEGLCGPQGKHHLALVEGATENATLPRDLLVGLRERTLDTTKPPLLVLDGAKGLHRAVIGVFEHSVIQRR